MVGEVGLGLIRFDRTASGDFLRHFKADPPPITLTTLPW